MVSTRFKLVKDLKTDFTKETKALVRKVVVASGEKLLLSKS